MTNFTFRTKVTQDKYDKFRKLHIDVDIRDLPVVYEFTHWNIVENQYPYDAFYETSHMLVPKRKTGDVSDISVLTTNEIYELLKIMPEYVYKEYDEIKINTPKRRSVESVYHLHLLNLKSQ